MIRFLTVADREPQEGDVIERHKVRVEVRYWKHLPISGKSCLHAMVLHPKGLTRAVGPSPYGGWWDYRKTFWMNPWRYVSRADGGQVTVPLDMGAWV